MSSARCRQAPEGDANLAMDIAVLGVLLRVSLTRAAGVNVHPAPPDAARFAPELMVAAAPPSYLQDATQAEIADRLGTSPTVSRLLAEARRVGIVRIDIVEPTDGGLDELARLTAASLDISKVWLVPAGTRPALGTALAPAVRQALAARLRAGDVLLVSSGRTVHAAAQAELPELPGVIIVPTVGGRDESEACYQTNEITRQVAVQVRTGVPPSSTRPSWRARPCAGCCSTTRGRAPGSTSGAGPAAPC